MIASRNTFTYLKPRDWKVKILSNFWCCQNLTIKQQYKAGVRYFDIRVFRDVDKWRICHNQVNFDKTFSNLRQICTYISNNFSNAVFRLILEKGDCAQFREEVRPIAGKYKALILVCIKTTGEILYKRDNAPEIINYSKTSFSILDKLFGIIFNPILKHSKKFKITQEMIEDQSKVYLIDYIK